MSVTPTDARVSHPSALQRYQQVRQFSHQIAEPLTPEDCMVQSMPDVSPTRWHLAHTTWFFETFILQPRSEYQVYDETFCYLFNSYYNTVGAQFPRPQRGLVSRPGLSRILAYRKHVDEAMERLLRAGDLDPDIKHRLEVGLHHEQQQ